MLKSLFEEHDKICMYVCMYVIMRWRVQLGINSTSDVWKFCQNWTSRRASQNWIRTSQCQHHILSPKPSRARRSTKMWCFCSYFHLVLLLKQNLVLFFYFHLVPSRQFHFTSVFKIPFRHFVCFGKIINCTAVQLMK